MKFQPLLPLFAALLFTTTAIAQYAPPDPSGLEGIHVELYYVSDSADAADTDGSAELDPGETTYRVFVDLKAGYKLLIVGGFVDHPVEFSTSTSFFNNDDRGEAWGDGINDIHLDKNTVAIDSWLTMGAASDAHWGIPKADDPDGSIVGGVNNDGGSNAVPDGLLINAPGIIGVPLTSADGLFAPSTPPAITSVGPLPTCFDAGGANSYSEESFSWGVLGGVEGPDTTNRILIGQFTTDGILNLCLNLWVRIPDSLVCNDPNCHEILEFYANLLPSDTAGGGFGTQNKFTRPDLCFDSSMLNVDCEGVPNGPAVPGSPCDDGDPITTNDTYLTDCTCAGEDCEGVLGGNALPGEPCDDGDPGTIDDVWTTDCTCIGVVGIVEQTGGTAVRVAPNPTQDLIQIEIEREQAEELEFDLRNALGQVVLGRRIPAGSGTWRGSLDLTEQPSGLYFLNVRIGATQQTVRVTVL